jgi:SAM-dependent methyltransferase
MATVAEGHRPIVDVGCGPEPVVPGAVGIDASMVMCRENDGPVVQADAGALPVRTASCGAAIADRVLQHLVDPVAGARELVRVTRHGGVVVVADPDQETLVIEVPDEPELCAAMKAYRRDRLYRNGTLARRHGALLRSLGLTAVGVEAYALALTDPDEAFGIPGWAEYWAREGTLDAAIAARWRPAVERAGAEGTFLYSVTFIVAWGTVP